MHQICYMCKIEKSLNEFTIRIDDTYYRMCKECVSSILSVDRGKKKERLHHTETHRTCYLCRRFLDVSRFTKRKTGTYFSACKDCNSNVFAQRRRARLKESEGSFSTEEWLALIEKFDFCPMCKRPWNEIPLLEGRSSVITRDHIIPISRGGSNSIENIQPLCYSCNSAKGNKMP